MHSRSVQVETVGNKTVGVQVEDSISAKKIELLMTANKKLKLDCDLFIQEKNSKIQTMAS